MFVSHQKRAIYLHNPKCAGITISKALKGMGFESIETNIMEERPSIIQRHRWNVPEKLQSYFIFTSVRHPLERMVSSWAYGIAKIHRDLWKNYGKPISFKEVANRKSFPLPPQKPYILQSEYLLRYEKLQDDFNNLPFLEEKIELPHLNKTDHKHWSVYFEDDPNLIKKSVDMWAEDFELLHYEIPSTEVNIALL